MPIARGLQELAEGILRKAFGVTATPLTKESVISITFSAGSPPGTEVTLEVYPPVNTFAIKYFRLVTPLDVEANISVVTLDGEEVALLSSNQPENTEEVYSADDWGLGLIHAKVVKLYAKTIRDITIDRVVELGFSGVSI
jgi:hypothetical protein